MSSVRLRLIKVYEGRETEIRPGGLMREDFKSIVRGYVKVVGDDLLHQLVEEAIDEDKQEVLW